MNKTKPTTVVITAMLIGLTAASIGVAEDVELGGSIKAEFVPDQPFGAKLTLNLTEDQEIDVTVEEDNGNYSVNTNLTINIEKIGFNERFFIIPRAMLAWVRIVKADANLFEKGRVIEQGVLPKLPIFSWFLGTSDLEIPIQYNVDDSIMSENLTIIIFVIGLPCPVNVSYTYEPNSPLESALIPLLPRYIGLQQFNVKVNYQYP